MSDVESDAAGTIDLGMLPGLLGYALRRAQLAVFQDFHRTLAPLALTPTQFGVLVVLHENPGLRPSQVAEALGIKRTNFVPLLAELERRGLAGRRGLRDRRAAALHLTREGDALFAEAQGLVEAHDHRFDAQIGEHGRAQLLALLHRLAE
jgi:DNA-binding MarR family transcriptional regulator